MRLFYLTILILLLVGCAVTKTPRVHGGSKADGTVRVHYNKNRFEDITVNWDVVDLKVLQTCRKWGYEEAERFEGGTSKCVGARDSFGCTSIDYIYEYQCSNLIYTK